MNDTLKSTGSRPYFLIKKPPADTEGFVTYHDKYCLLLFVILDITRVTKMK